MEPKGFLIYPNRGIAHALSSNFKHEQYLLIAYTKNILPMVFTEYLHKGITFFLGLNF
jgi:hypothetical protein